LQTDIEASESIPEFLFFQNIAFKQEITAIIKGEHSLVLLEIRKSLAGTFLFRLKDLKEIVTFHFSPPGHRILCHT